MKLILLILILGLPSTIFAEGSGVGSGGKPPPKRIRVIK